MTTRRQLAQLYFPDSTPETAVRHLRRWIHRCTELHRLLTTHNSGFDKSKYLSVWEVRKIMEYLGEP